MAKYLREQQFPVFPEEVIKLVAHVIEKAGYADYFPGGLPTREWYHGWLRIMEFLTGPPRPLEETRVAWHTEPNLEKYFKVARDVLLKAGVMVRNVNFDPNKSYSEEILIIALERICIYDERRVELDCTRATNGKTDMVIGTNR
jgi:hypothetical protein